MSDYMEWSRLEREFRNIHTRHPNLYASWDSLDGNWAGFGGLDHDEDRFRSLCGIAAALVGCQPPQDPTTGWLDSVKTLLLNSGSGKLEIWEHARYQQPGVLTGVGATWSDPSVKQGKIYTIRALCRVFADCCLENAARSLTPPPSKVKIASPASLAQKREMALQIFVRDHKTTIAAVSRAARVDKKNLLQWRHGTLADSSAMSLRIENVLSGKTALIFGGVPRTRTNPGGGTRARKTSPAYPLTSI